MADVYVSSLPDGTVAGTSYVMCDDAGGTTTFRVQVSAIVALVTDASQLTAGTLPDARLSANIVRTTDSRLSDSRTPSAHKGSHSTGGSDALSPTDIGAAAASHAHGNVTSDGKVGSTSGVPLITGAAGVIQAGAFGSSAGQYCQGNDSRLSDARTPTSHASSHQAGGSDVIAAVPTTTNLSADTNALAVSASDIVRLTSSAAVNVNGLNATGCSDGKMVLLVNENAAGGAAITIKHLSSSATTGNRMRSQFGSDIVLQPDGGQVLVHLSSVAGCWRA